MAAVIRIAALGDVHFAGKESAGRLRPHLARLHERADVLLLAGDLTHHGTAEESRVLAEEVAGLSLPVVAVLGNHDYHGGAEDQIRTVLGDAGVHVLEGETVIVPVDGRVVGIAGVKGFGGGFAGACGTEFGEPEMKAFIRHTKAVASQLAGALRSLEARAQVRVALLHYAPIKGTLLGEKLEVYPFLGSYLLAEAIDHARADLVIHGHAHHGTERGVTPGGVPVRNVALPVIKFSYNVYWLGGEPSEVFEDGEELEAEV